MGVSVKAWGSNRYWRVVSPFAPAIALVAVQLIWFGMPMGAWIRGVVLGLLTALLAMGMALVYRANRVVNFAQADLGFVPTTLAVGLILFSGLPYLFGFGIGMTAAIALGAVVEFSLVRRFSKASRLVLTVATIGITQLLAVLALLVPRMWGETATSQRIPPPFDWKLTVGTFILTANDLIALIVAPIAMVAVAAVPRQDPARHRRPRCGRAERTGADARHPRRVVVDARVGDRRRALVPRPVPARRHHRRAARYGAQHRRARAGTRRARHRTSPTPADGGHHRRRPRHPRVRRRLERRAAHSSSPRSSAPPC